MEALGSLPNAFPPNASPAKRHFYDRRKYYIPLCSPRSLRLRAKQKLYFAQRRGERRGRNFIFLYSLRSLRLRAKQKLYFAQRRGERRGREFYFFVFSAFFAPPRKTKIYFAQRREERRGREFYFFVFSAFFAPPRETKIIFRAETRRTQRKKFYLCNFFVSIAPSCATFLKKVAYEGTKNTKEGILFLYILRVSACNIFCVGSCIFFFILYSVSRLLLRFKFLMVMWWFDLNVIVQET
jgi:hypothetical protein